MYHFESQQPTEQSRQRASPWSKKVHLGLQWYVRTIDTGRIKPQHTTVGFCIFSKLDLLCYIYFFTYILVWADLTSTSKPQTVNTECDAAFKRKFVWRRRSRSSTVWTWKENRSKSAWQNQWTRRSAKGRWKEKWWIKICELYCFLLVMNCFSLWRAPLAVMWRMRAQLISYVIRQFEYQCNELNNRFAYLEYC